jgi:ubiquitin-conjugating enzyme E2 W
MSNMIDLFFFVFQSHPPDNDWYVRTASNDPKKTRWWYHDDAV